MNADSLRDESARDLQVILVGSYFPRRCGIATFTYDLTHSLSDILGRERCRVVAVNNRLEGYSYPQEVSFEIQQDRIQDYQRAAEYINFSNAKLVCLQHEFGIFGGRAGVYLSSLIDNLKKPLVTTLHTVIKEPTAEYRKAMDHVVRQSQMLVVMSETGSVMLQEVYGVDQERIAVIPHGVPDFHFVDPNFFKDQLGVEGRFVILTFGLIGPNKGIEVMLEALPPVVERHPEITYVILGATHPEVAKTQGERYRLSLERKARDLGLQSNVVFQNRFVDIGELCDYICASDLYVTPYLSQEQIVSGTLAYAVGAGKAVISTPYWYAAEILDDGRGILVGFKNVAELSGALLDLLDNPVQLHRMRKKAYEFGRQMVWKEVANRYVEVLHKVLQSDAAIQMKVSLGQRMLPQATLPEIKLDHLWLLTDEVGILQHAAYGVPDRNHGYSTDDVARALVVVQHLQQENVTDDLHQPVSTYLSYLHHAQTLDGHFRNYVSYERRFLDEKGSEDMLGRVVWGLGTTVRLTSSENLRALAQNMVEKAEPHLHQLNAPRAKAYAMCGLHAILQRYEGASWCRRLVRKLADDMAELYEVYRKSDWEWFEPIITYGNAKLSEAMLLAFEVTGEAAFKQIGLNTLDFLTKCQFNGQFFDLVGNDGWFPYGGAKATFGQQPIDAGYLVQAYTTAHRLTNETHYLTLAQLAFEWFLGRNRCGAPLYDFTTGACADGLDSQGVSQNQGAESVICYLLALLGVSQSGAQRSEARLSNVKFLEVRAK
ncbi:MAG: glycosyltransferase family 4 protein [Chloroflexi bacterium]|nr:glycosyltransferase family 4 protein [Chloroflexota bacterium]